MQGTTTYSAVSGPACIAIVCANDNVNRGFNSF
jgi:hypothetical protein